MKIAKLWPLANHICATHVSFAGHRAEDAREILEAINQGLSEAPAMIGATFEALRDERHGNRRTVITIIGRPDGGWEFEEWSYEKAKRLGLV